MKIQSISNVNFQRNILKSAKAPKKAQKALDPIQEMNRNFTKAAIAIVLLEIGMGTAAYFKNKKAHEAVRQKIEAPAIDSQNPQQNTLWINE